MDIAATLRAERRRAGLSQARLAALTGTSQATISAYEARRKQPSVATLERLLAATGARLGVEHAARVPSRAEHERVASSLVAVLALAAALPVRHERALHFPRLP